MDENRTCTNRCRREYLYKTGKVVYKLQLGRAVYCLDLINTITKTDTLIMILILNDTDTDTFTTKCQYIL